MVRLSIATTIGKRLKVSLASIISNGRYPTRLVGASSQRFQIPRMSAVALSLSIWRKLEETFELSLRGVIPVSKIAGLLGLNFATCSNLA
jgi:hypothetical protein